jgi:hypothetical protein
MRYKVKLNKTEEGYAVWCPSLPGCWSQGETKAASAIAISSSVNSALSAAASSLEMASHLCVNSY